MLFFTFLCPPPPQHRLSIFLGSVPIRSSSDLPRFRPLFTIETHHSLCPAINAPLVSRPPLRSPPILRTFAIEFPSRPCYSSLSANSSPPPRVQGQCTSLSTIYTGLRGGVLFLHCLLSLPRSPPPLTSIISGLCFMSCYKSSDFSTLLSEVLSLDQVSPLGRPKPPFIPLHTLNCPITFCIGLGRTSLVDTPLQRPHSPP